MTPLRATATLGTASVVVLVAGAVSAKVVAVIGGPVGVGTVSVLASVLSLAGLVGGFGVAVHLIRTVAADQSNAQSVTRAHRSARITVLLTSSTVAILLVAARDWIATALLGGMATGFDVGLIAVALVFQSLAGVEAALINGLHRVAALAIVTAASGIATAGALSVAVVAGGSPAIAWGMLTGAVVTGVIMAVASHLVGPPTADRDVVARADVRKTALASAPFAVSQVVGTGSQLLIPLVVLFSSDAPDVGLYRAAATISVAYLAFLVAAMGQDYLPRLAAAPTKAVGETVRTQLELLLRVAVPVILATYAIAPVIVQLLYTKEFAPTAPLLRWLLIGDLVKLCSWSVSFVILARAPSQRFMVVEGLAGITLLGLTVLGTSALGLVGAGVAYALTYVVYYLVVHVGSRGLFAHRVSRPEALTFALAFALALLQTTGDPEHPMITFGLLGAAVVLAAILLVPMALGTRHRSTGGTAGASAS